MPLEEEGQEGDERRPKVTIASSLKPKHHKTCGFFFLCLMNSVALACGTFSIFTCVFVERTITYKNYQPLVVPVGASNERFIVMNICNNNGTNVPAETQCELFASDHSIGFWGWIGYISVENRRVCFTFEQYITGAGGYVTPDFDVLFEVAKWSGVAASFFGCMGFLTCFAGSCCPLSRGRISFLALYYLLACVGQGLTFLVFQSDVCQETFFAPYFSAYPSIVEHVDSVTCSLDRGSIAGIATTIMYYICFLCAPGINPPLPLGMSHYDVQQLENLLKDSYVHYEKEEDDENDDNAAVAATCTDKQNDTINANPDTKVQDDADQQPEEKKKGNISNQHGAKSILESFHNPLRYSYSLILGSETGQKLLTWQHFQPISER